MLKSISSIKGVKHFSRLEQKNIKGGFNNDDYGVCKTPYSFLCGIPNHICCNQMCVLETHPACNF
ncbi:hypothetical protein [Aquimarina celericrescens]|uniref:Bacteriocin n=1 Tax=Aquimarina celericrescens TaxID=1964542 RepID=A0ABW5B3K8_9FLAO